MLSHEPSQARISRTDHARTPRSSSRVTVVSKTDPLNGLEKLRMPETEEVKVRVGTRDLIEEMPLKQGGQ